MVGLLKYYLVKHPAQLVYFVTSKCNAACHICFYRNRENAGELTIAEIEKITKRIFPVYSLLLSGGEPFLRDDIDEIVTLFHRNAGVKYAQIPTNGFLSGKIIEKSGAILESCPTLKLVISVSLDAIGESHDTIRRLDDCYRRACATVDLLKNLKKGHARLGVNINMTFSSYNQEKITEYYRHFRDVLRPDKITVGYVRGETSDRQAKNVNMRYYSELAAMLSNDRRNEDGRGIIRRMRDERDKLQRELVRQIEETGLMPLACSAGTHSLVMSEDGTIYPCEILNRKLGNLRDMDYDFKKLWKSNTARTFRKWEKTCACTYECALSTSILFNPRMAARIIGRTLAK
jgi:MoaA/NifB/PqqE/SkfB family radical SAM enzyme